MKTVRLTYCGMDGEGPTVREAKQDATRKIEAYLKADTTPIVVSYAGVTRIAWRAPEGWRSGYTHDGKGLNGGTCFEGSADREAVERRSRLAVAQAAADLDGDDASAIVLHDGDKRELASYLDWQRRHRAWMRAGATSNEAHARACNGLWPETARILGPGEGGDWSA